MFIDISIAKYYNLKSILLSETYIKFLSKLYSDLNFFISFEEHFRFFIGI